MNDVTRDMGFKIKRGKVGILLLHRLCGTPVEMRFVANGLADQVVREPAHITAP